MYNEIGGVGVGVDEGDVDFEDDEGTSDDRFNSGGEEEEDDIPDFDDDDDSFNEISNGLVVNVVHSRPATSYSSDFHKRHGAGVRPAVSPPSSWFSSREDSSPVYHSGTQINIGSLTIGLPLSKGGGGGGEGGGGGGGAGGAVAEGAGGGKGAVASWSCS